MKEHHGLAKQFIRIIALAALESVLLLTVSQVVLAKGLRFWFSRTEVQQHATQKQVQELQSYVTEHHLASTDVKELTDWSHKRRYTLLELYRRDDDLMAVLREHPINRQCLLQTAVPIRIGRNDNVFHTLLSFPWASAPCDCSTTAAGSSSGAGCVPLRR